MGKYDYLLEHAKLDMLEPGDGPIVTKPGVKVSFDSMTGDDHREFVAYIKAHPEKLMSWDSAGLSFSEYVKKVEAGDYD